MRKLKAISLFVSCLLVGLGASAADSHVEKGEINARTKAALSKYDSVITKFNKWSASNPASEAWSKAENDNLSVRFTAAEIKKASELYSDIRDYREELGRWCSEPSDNTARKFAGIMDTCFGEKGFFSAVTTATTANTRDGANWTMKFSVSEIEACRKATWDYFQKKQSLVESWKLDEKDFAADKIAQEKMKAMFALVQKSRTSGGKVSDSATEIQSEAEAIESEMKGVGKGNLCRFDGKKPEPSPSASPSPGPSSARDKEKDTLPQESPAAANGTTGTGGTPKPSFAGGPLNYGGAGTQYPTFAGATPNLYDNGFAKPYNNNDLLKGLANGLGGYNKGALAIPGAYPPPPGEAGAAIAAAPAPLPPPFIPPPVGAQVATGGYPPPPPPPGQVPPPFLPPPPQPKNNGLSVEVQVLLAQNAAKRDRDNREDVAVRVRVNEVKPLSTPMPTLYNPMLMACSQPQCRGMMPQPYPMPYPGYGMQQPRYPQYPQYPNLIGFNGQKGYFGAGGIPNPAFNEYAATTPIGGSYPSLFNQPQQPFTPFGGTGTTTGGATNGTTLLGA